jgi:hypothetical protein
LSKFLWISYHFIIIIEIDKADKEADEKLVDDVLQILDVYTAKMNEL